MSDAQNLNDFFAQNSKKKKNQKKPAAAKAKPAAAVETREEEVKEETPAVQTETQQQAQDFADSSDDESNTIVLNEGRQKVIDRKDVDAQKKTSEENATDASAGWGLGSKFGTQAQSSTASQPSSASATGPSAGGQMTFGKPMFSRKKQGIMDTQDFPDLDAASSSKNQVAGASKANSAMMFSGGAAARGPREAQAQEEIKTGATKPVFRGKAKFQTGGASNEEVANSRMNYDFSKMNMSAATTKAAEGETRGPDGERRRGPGQGRSFNEDDDFEVVTDVKKKAPRRNFEEPTFGGGMPTFTRGGENRK